MTIALWDARTGNKKQALKGHISGGFSVAFAPDGKTLASGSRAAVIKLWDAQTGQVKRTLKAHTREVHCVAFSPDGKTLASGGAYGTIELRDVQALLAPLPQPSFAGKWDVSLGPLALTVGQNQVTGSYPLFNGRIEGVLSKDGKSITGTWKQSNGASGGFVLKLSQDGDRIQGRRWVGKKSVDGTGYAWSGKRID